MFDLPLEKPMAFVPDQEIEGEGRLGDQSGIFYAACFQDIDGTRLNTSCLES